ncbi:hypothetical protein, partial [Heyndrickxia coagulans]
FRHGFRYYLFPCKKVLPRQNPPFLLLPQGSNRILMTAGNVKKLVPKTPDFYQKLGCWVVQHSLEMSKSSSLIREKILEK